MSVSLVIGSTGRVDPLRRFFDSVVEQRAHLLEVIVVEQVDPASVSALIASYPQLPIRVEISRPGLSRARNVGLENATGSIVGFPDDDCWYMPETLPAVVEYFNTQPAKQAVLGGHVMTPAGDMIPYPREPVEITTRNVWKTIVSPGLFVRREVADVLSGFDENLGVGSGTQLGSGEETDFVLRAIADGFGAAYEPRIQVMHPAPHEVSGRLNHQLGANYGRGMGYVMGRHGYGLVDLLRNVTRPAIGAMIAAAAGDRELATFRRGVARGRAQGYRIGRSGV